MMKNESAVEGVGHIILSETKAEYSKELTSKLPVQKILKRNSIIRNEQTNNKGQKQNQRHEQ
jgi:hypothetical protein